MAGKPEDPGALHRELRALHQENDYLRDRFEAVSNQFLNLSQELTERDFGTDRVAAAIEAVRRADNSVQAWVVTQNDPYRSLVEWHKTSMN
jgi:hypothetical protein